MHQPDRADVTDEDLLAFTTSYRRCITTSPDLRLDVWIDGTACSCSHDKDEPRSTFNPDVQSTLKINYSTQKIRSMLLINTQFVSSMSKGALVLVLTVSILVVLAHLCFVFRCGVTSFVDEAALPSLRADSTSVEGTQYLVWRWWSST